MGRALAEVHSDAAVRPMAWMPSSLEPVVRPRPRNGSLRRALVSPHLWAAGTDPHEASMAPCPVAGANLSRGTEPSAGLVSCSIKRRRSFTVSVDLVGGNVG